MKLNRERLLEMFPEENINMNGLEGGILTLLGVFFLCTLYVYVCITEWRIWRWKNGRK